MMTMIGSNQVGLVRATLMDSTNIGNTRQYPLCLSQDQEQDNNNQLTVSESITLNYMPRLPKRPSIKKRGSLAGSQHEGKGHRSQYANFYSGQEMDFEASRPVNSQYAQYRAKKRSMEMTSNQAESLLQRMNTEGKSLSKLGTHSRNGHRRSLAMPKSHQWHPAVSRVWVESKQLQKPAVEDETLKTQSMTQNL